MTTPRAERPFRSSGAGRDRIASDVELVFVTLILWVASLADVVGVLLRGGPFGGIHTLALLALGACSFVLVRAVVDAVRARL